MSEMQKSYMHAPDSIQTIDLHILNLKGKELPAKSRMGNSNDGYLTANIIPF